MTLTIEAIFFKIRNLLLEGSGQLIFLGSSMATQYPGLSRLPFGRDAKRSSALLRALEREKPFPAVRA
jgi:hypothetical protein